MFNFAEKPTGTLLGYIFRRIEPMRLPSYLQVSPYGIYYFRAVFPESIRLQIQRREFKRSLRTADRRLAIKISRAFKGRADRIFDQVISKKMDWVKTKKLLDQVATDILAEFKEYIYVHGAYPDNIANYPEKQAENEARYYLEIKRFPLDHPDLSLTDEEIESAYGMDSDAAKDIIWRRNGAKLSEIESVRKFAEKIITDEQLTVTDREFELFSQHVAEMLWSLSVNRDNLINFSIPENNFLKNNADFNLNKIDYETTSVKNVVTKSNINKLNDIFESYIYSKNKVKKSINNNEVVNYRKKFDLTYKILQYIICEEDIRDLFLEEITNDHVTSLKFYIERMPLSLSKNFKKYKISDVCMMIKGQWNGDLSDDLKVKLSKIISIQTMLNYTTPLRNCVDHAVSNKIVQDNIFSHFKFTVPKKLKRENEGKSFSNIELESIFNTEIFSKKVFDKSYKYWVPVALLYTGARLNDICNLKIIDIINIDGIDCINISESKTEAGKRIVPLHSQLITLGFLNFVKYKELSGSIYLFDELPEYKTKSGRVVDRGNTVGKWFNQKNEKDTHVGYLNKCNVTGKGKRLHSFRNTFINHLKQQRVQNEEVKAVVGHVSDDMTFATYADPYKLSVLKDVVEQINYRGIRLPWITNKHYKKLKFPWED